MSDHYYSKKPQSKSTPKTWNFQLKDSTYTFTSDVGVFSKNTVDFGTHLLIEHFSEPKIPGDILDLGCGYGPIGISLARTFKDRIIVMADINERAIQLAKENAIQNNVENIEVVQSDQFSSLKSRTFSAIVTNPPIRAGKQTIYKMFEESEAALQKNGQLWIVIQKKQGAPSAKRKLESLFGHVEVVTRKKGYFIFSMTKT